eukprot:9487701-Pyramimonas_sp.AAC.1
MEKGAGARSGRKSEMRRGQRAEGGRGRGEAARRRSDWLRARPLDPSALQCRSRASPPPAALARTEEGREEGGAEDCRGGRGGGVEEGRGKMEEGKRGTTRRIMRCDGRWTRGAVSFLSSPPPSSILP